jgi:serine/threonine protein kinase
MSIAFILWDLLHAIEYLHNEGKIHRDIKGFANFFIFFNLLLISVLPVIIIFFHLNACLNGLSTDILPTKFWQLQTYC